jgi:hypothetical protein
MGREEEEGSSRNIFELVEAPDERPGYFSPIL